MSDYTVMQMGNVTVKRAISNSRIGQVPAFLLSATTPYPNSLLNFPSNFQASEQYPRGILRFLWRIFVSVHVCPSTSAKRAVFGTR